jgi:AraC-like DNA-binding protein
MSNKYPEARLLTPEIIRAPTTQALIYFRVIHLLVYYFLARRQLKSYRRSIKHLFSETSVINFSWANLLINGFLCIVITNVIIFPLMFRFPEQAFLLLLINMAIATPYIYVVTVKGISQPSVWQAQTGMKKEEIEKEFQEAEVLETQNEEHRKEKPLKPVVDTKLDLIVKNVITLMEKDKLYHEPELTLQQLANQLQLPTYLVSQAINDGLDKNFYELINRYRVEEAKQLLIDPKNSNFTILSIGFEAGFNSKTTFNTVFKKFTGLTPTEYRDKQKLGVAIA